MFDYLTNFPFSPSYCDLCPFQILHRRHQRLNKGPPNEVTLQYTPPSATNIYQTNCNFIPVKPILSSIPQQLHHLPDIIRKISARRLLFVSANGGNRYNSARYILSTIPPNINYRVMNTPDTYIRGCWGDV